MGYALEVSITIAEIQEKSETNKTAENHAENDALIKAEEMKNTLLINNTDTNVIINTNTTGENKTVVDTETILKYVYKENEKKEQEKTKGHVKNSLLRRKRLTFDSLGPSNAPLIVNYETSHQPHHAHFRQPYQTHHIQPYQIHQAQISNPTEGNPDKFIKKSNLARFSLETLHDEIVNSNTRHREEPNKNDEKKIENEKVPPLRSQESTESDENISDTSREVDDEKSSLIKPEESVSKYDRTNQESGERDRPSNDNNDDSDHKSNRKPISNENIQSSETENDLPGQTQGNSGDVVSKENYRNTERSSDRDSNEGGETDTDTSSEYSSHKKRHRKNNEKDEKLPIKIQDVDLDDFSNEKLKLNKHGRVEPIIEDPDNNNQDSSAEHNPRENSKYKQQQNNNDDVKPIIEIGSNSESIESNEEIEVDKAHTSPDKKGHISEYYKKPNNYVDGVLKPFIEIVPNSDTVESSEEENPRDANKAGDNSEYRDHPKNNVDEVKPVIEIGADSESTESDEEQEELKPQKQSPDDDDENVEAFRDSASGRKAGIIANLNQNNDNVKQEFERIPRNYNHDNSKTGKKTSEKEDAAETDDVPPARDGHYDDNLNFKFDDVPLHLPEVKLPEDVLAYNRKDPKKPEEQDHNSNEQEEEEEEDEESSKNTNGNENESAEDSYEHVHDNYDYKSSPFKKEHPKGKSYANKYYNQHDDDVDLYEKFVAERFGKRDTFKKRSQKLQELRFEPTNPELYEQVGKILKKTKQTTMEAAKSGDPNAGYAWTLEYGQKLV